MVGICKEQDCELEVTARGLCRRHYERFRYNALRVGQWPPEENLFTRTETRTREKIAEHLEALAAKHRAVVKAMENAERYERRLAQWLRSGV